MSDELPDSGSDHAPVDVAVNGSQNGVHHDDAGAVATAIAPTAEDSENAGSIDVEPEVAEATGASATAVSSDFEEGGSAADATVETDASATTNAAGDDDTGFLAELVRAMQTTAAAERARLGEDADRRRDAHVASVEARRAAEVERMRQLAADDLAGIDSWAESERQRIQAEHDRRAADLQADLESSLAEHGGRIDREIAAVQAAVATYRADVDAFFATLDRETDPVAIARQASQRPAFPVLEAIGADAANETAAAADRANPGATTAADSAPSTDGEGAGVGVMAESLTPDAQGPVRTAPSTGDEPSASDERPVSAETWVSSAGSTPVLQSVPISRPMSWLRRDRDQDHPDR